MPRKSHQFWTLNNFRDVADMNFAGSGHVLSEGFQQSSFQRLSAVRFVDADAQCARFDVDGNTLSVSAHAQDTLRLTFGQFGHCGINSHLRFHLLIST